MRVGTVELYDFRSYTHADLTFEAGVNVLVGPNGVGKTNVVEAVGYASTLSSHRVAADLPLVRRAAAQAIVRVQAVRTSADNSQRAELIEIAITPGRANRIQISGSPVRARDVVGHLRTVSFAPEDLSLVKGDPSDRRRLIDEVLVQRAPRYVAVRADYERVVRQRTALLRSMAGTRGATARAEAGSTLAVWDGQLIETGAALLFGRLSLLKELGGRIEAAYTQVAPGKAATVGYDPRSFSRIEAAADLPRDREQLEDLLRDEIECRRPDELARGMTLVGPHRDDLALRIDDMPAKNYGSHGECWSLALAMRLGSFDLMRSLDDGSGDPVLILDDVFAELDQSRRDALVNVAVSSEQVLITAAVAHDVPGELAGSRFTVTPGQVTRD